MEWLELIARALAAGLLASVACGTVGTYVVARRMASASGGLAHAAFGGVGLGYWLQVPPIWGALLFAAGAAAILARIERRGAAAIDALISALWPIGMALGLIFAALAPGYAPDLTSFLFGNLLLATPEYVAWTAALDLVLLAVLLSSHRLLEAICFDEEFAAASGLPVGRGRLVLFLLVAVAVVTLIRVVGIVLASALLTLPALAVRPWSRNLATSMALASGVCGACVAIGLAISTALSLAFDVSVPPGATIVLVAAGAWGGSNLVAGRRTRAVALYPRGAMR